MRLISLQYISKFTRLKLFDRIGPIRSSEWAARPWERDAKSF